MDEADYLSEFEELLKIKDFYKDEKMKMAFDCTYEQIAKSLKNEYAENIKEKINRWVNVTHIMYFENAKPVSFYFQSKMLFRDGFYESSITLSRTICEMICYDLLSKISHPFDDLELIEVPSFRLFVNFLAIPKKIEKNFFEKQIIEKLNDLDDKNFVKSSYQFDKTTNFYIFKIDNGKKNSNLERFFKIFKEVNFNSIDSFKNDTHEYFHRVYDIGNIYVHAKKKLNPPKDDATECLNLLAHILSDIYGLKTSLENNKMIKSGYSDFPDICTGINFAIEVAKTQEDAMRTYLNRPCKEHFDLMLQTVGTWSGEWKNEKGTLQTGILTFFLKNETHLNANLKYKNLEKPEPMEIKLFGNYFHLIGFDEKDMKHKKNEHVLFELEFFSDKLLIGQSLEHQGKAIFQRIE